MESNIVYEHFSSSFPLYQMDHRTNSLIVLCVHILIYYRVVHDAAGLAAQQLIKRRTTSLEWSPAKSGC